MVDLRRKTVAALRALARKRLGAAAARLTTKEALVRALSGEAGKKRSPAKPKIAKPGKAAKLARRPQAAKPGKPARRAKAAAPPGEERTAGDGAGAADPAGFFVARVRGEGAVREAPHPMVEARAPAARGPAPAAPRDEQLGELPASYGEDTLVLLPRDPTTLFAFWDQAEDTLRGAFREMAQPRVELWLWARAGDGWDRVRVVELALEPHGWYLHGLEPGRSYRAELRAVDGGGRERALGPGSAEVALPPASPSRMVDDRFVRLPWDQPLGPPLGPGRRGPEFPSEARDALGELSGWAGEEGAAGGGARHRPTSGRPTSPGGEGER